MPRLVEEALDVGGDRGRLDGGDPGTTAGVMRKEDERGRDDSASAEAPGG